MSERSLIEHVTCSGKLRNKSHGTSVSFYIYLIGINSTGNLDSYNHLRQYVTLYHKPPVKSAPDQFGFIVNFKILWFEL